MVVHFNRLADGSFLPASYRRLDGPAEFARDRALIEEGMAAFLDLAARTKDLEPLPAKRRPRRAMDLQRQGELEQVPIG